MEQGPGREGTVPPQRSLPPQPGHATVDVLGSWGHGCCTTTWGYQTLGCLGVVAQVRSQNPQEACNWGQDESVCLSLPPMG